LIRNDHTAAGVMRVQASSDGMARILTRPTKLDGTDPFTGIPMAEALRVKQISDAYTTLCRIRLPTRLLSRAMTSDATLTICLCGAT
jgi:hypothetical protein